MFMWLSEQLAVIAKTWKFSEMMVLQLLGGHDPDMFCSNLIKGLKPVLSEFPQAFGFFQRHILSVTMKCCPSICPWVKQYFSICQQEKERIGINSRTSTKMLLLKILFGYQFSHLHCLNCLGSMLVWFFDAAFDIFWILHPTVHFVTDKLSIQLHLSFCLDQRFQKQCLTHFTRFTRSFQAMPSMSYELVAGADITCGSWMFLACHCCDIRPYVFIRLPLGCKSTSSVYLYLKSCIRVWFLGCRRCILWDCSWPRKPHMTFAHVMVWGHLLQFPDKIEAGDMYASILGTYLVFWYHTYTTSFPHISSD